MNKQLGAKPDDLNLPPRDGLALSVIIAAACPNNAASRRRGLPNSRQTVSSCVTPNGQ